MAEPSASGSSIASPTVIKAAAPLLFGPVFNWALYGVLCVQTYVYSYNFPEDRRSVKFLVYFVFLLETVQTALTGADVYYWFVAGFGNVERLGTPHLTPIDVSINLAVVSLVVQGYFCYRIWVLNKRRLSWVCWVIAVAAVTQSVAVLYAGIKSLVAGKYVVPNALYVWSISSALSDVLIAVAMTLLLRRESGKFTSFVLIRVVRLTIETNALTAALAITSLVLYAAFPNELYYVYTAEIIGKAYSNTLLVSLNNRIYLRDHRLPEHGDSTGSPVFDEARARTMIPLRFAIPTSEPQPRALKNDVFLRPATPRPVDLDNSSVDDNSIDLSMFQARASTPPI